MYHLRSIPVVLILSAVVLTGCTTIDWNRTDPSLRSPAYIELGEVEVRTELWNPLWRLSEDERLERLLSEAADSAIDTFGDGVVLGSVDVVAIWDARSLLYAFGSLGQVERARLRAVAWLPAPPPPPEPAPEPEPEPEPEPSKMTIVTFPIEPRSEVRDSYGYIRIEYSTREETAALVRATLEKRKASEEEIVSEIAGIADGGRIRIHIGRQDLMHADTIWYSYALYEEGKAILERSGQRGIPNIKGRDGNWWNVVELPVDRAVTERMRLEILDEKVGKRYEYSIVRHERVVTAEAR